MRYNRWSTQILQIMHDLTFYNYNYAKLVFVQFLNIPLMYV